uniref:Cyclin_C_2 domain-containing protein n=1 Tax=Globodera pallida TaxID=36090 RepID=A0A183C4M0_GLOPA
MEYYPKNVMMGCYYLAAKVDEFNISIDNFIDNLRPVSSEFLKNSLLSDAMFLYSPSQMALAAVKFGMDKALGEVRSSTLMLDFLACLLDVDLGDAGSKGSADILQLEKLQVRLDQICKLTKFLAYTQKEGELMPRLIQLEKAGLEPSGTIATFFFFLFTGFLTPSLVSFIPVASSTSRKKSNSLSSSLSVSALLSSSKCLFHHRGELKGLQDSLSQYFTPNEVKALPVSPTNRLATEQETTELNVSGATIISETAKAHRG